MPGPGSLLAQAPPPVTGPVLPVVPQSDGASGAEQSSPAAGGPIFAGPYAPAPIAGGN
ncbi:MAG: hypothetical protein M3O32_13760 [Actinomycetota bacterium]|nr:hypothetical protein [Actinomycetota bacterium]